jgi:glycosyltransferase involved in cell wall biosynthesis
VIESLVSDTTPPLVSVIIPFFMHGEFLGETVRTIEEQDYPNLEVILVDDGSPVPVEHFLPERHNVRIIHKPNAGVSAARNRGFQESSGEYVLFMDADDRLPPGSIGAHMKVFASHPETQLTFGARRFIDQAGNITQKAIVCRERRNYFRMLLESNPIGGPGSCMMRREIFIRSGGFREGKATAEDYDLWLRIARLGQIRRHVECVLEYRTHGNNVSSQTEVMLAGTMETLDTLERTLEPKYKKRLQWGRRRWIHRFRPRPGIAYRIRGTLFRVRAMLDVPPVAYWREVCSKYGQLISMFGVRRGITDR